MPSNVPKEANPSRALPSYWASLTDEALLGATFRADDPTALADVLLELPATDETPNIEFAYNTKTGTGQKVRCVHCHRTLHNRGFVLRFSDGSRILVGKDCGREIYGADFTLIERDFETARDRAGYIRRQRLIRTAAPAFVAHLTDLLVHPSLQAFRTLRSEYLRRLPELARLTGEACYQQGGTLMIDEEFRDYDAEERREKQREIEAERWAKMGKHEKADARQAGKRFRPNQKLKPLFKYIPKAVGALRGQAFFQTRDEPPDEILKVLIPTLVTEIGKLDADRLTNRQYALTYKEITELLDKVGFELARLASPLEAFELSHLTFLADWATKRSRAGSQYSAGIGSITVDARSLDEPATVTCPTTYSAPSKRLIATFRDVVTETNTSAIAS